MYMYNVLYTCEYTKLEICHAYCTFMEFFLTCRQHVKVQVGGEVITTVYNVHVHVHAHVRN